MINLLEIGVAFEIFGLSIKWYGIIIATGVLVAVLVACYNAKFKNYSKDFPYEILLWCFPLAIVGARVYYILFSGESYTFVEAISIWNGGLAIYGGIIGGLIGLILYSLIRNQNLLKVTDLVVPSLVIAQAIGRWGNFANQEVYGTVVNNPDLQWFPFAVYIDRLQEWHYATFFYESMICVLIFVVLMIIFRKTKAFGIVSGVYLILYGIERYFLEGMRQESEILFIGDTNIPVSQVVSIICVIAGLGLLIYVTVMKLKKVRAELAMQNNNSNHLQNLAETTVSNNKIVNATDVDTTKVNAEQKEIIENKVENKS